MKTTLVAICKRCKEETLSDEVEDYCSVCSAPLSPSDFKREEIADIIKEDNPNG